MTVEEAKLKYGDPRNGGYIFCKHCPLEHTNYCICRCTDDDCFGYSDTWKRIADHVNKEEFDKKNKCTFGNCGDCSHELLDFEHLTCQDCIEGKADNYDEKSCYNCKHTDKYEDNEPCSNCKHRFWEYDDEYSKHEDLWESPYCIPEPTETDNVNHPSHYNNGGMECIDEMILIFGVEATKHFCLLNAWKYRYRANHKNGQEDLDKANWYIAKYKELSENE